MAAQLLTPSGFHPLQATPSEPRELVRARIALRRAHGVIAGERRLLAGAVERLAAHATQAVAQAGSAAGGGEGASAPLCARGAVRWAAASGRVHLASTNGVARPGAHGPEGFAARQGRKRTRPSKQRRVVEQRSMAMGERPGRRR